MGSLTDIPGIHVGHVSDYDALTGCTAILCEEGAVGGVDVRGSATGTAELDLLNPLHVTSRIHAVCFAGGSAFGLEAGAGVRRYLGGKGVGVPTPAAKIPLVPSAILYDLGLGKSHIHPTREMGEAAAKAATSQRVPEGAVGAGTGATVGKLFGMKQAMKGGIGSWSITLGGQYEGVRVAALAAVNAFGDVRDPDTNRLIAGARSSPESRDLVDTAAAMRHGAVAGSIVMNTTLVAVATNAQLTKVEATKLAQLAHLGMARAISPVNTTNDGDLVIALSIGTARADVNTLGVAAAMAVERAIVRAVQLVPSMGGVPGLAG